MTTTERIHAAPIEALAYEFLKEAIEQWAERYSSLAPHSERLAHETAEYVFNELLGIKSEEVGARQEATETNPAS